MTHPVQPDRANQIVDLLLHSTLGAAGQDAASRLSLDGVAWSAGQDGALEIHIRRCEAASLRLAAGPLVAELDRLALHQAVLRVRLEQGQARLVSLEAASAELSGVKLQGPLAFAATTPGGAAARAAAPSLTGATHAGAATTGAWKLGPLAAADGSIRAEIVDAHLLFDAEVTVPIHAGQVDFNQASVEHVGPDSRMGVSRLGLYVDAPNGRSYLHQFSSAPVAGVEYEKRGALPGPFASDRGRLQLQPFGEWLLRQLGAGHNLALTEQALLLFDRTAVSGEVQLGDGSFAAPGAQAELAGRAEGRNTVRIHSVAVGRGVTLDMPSVLARDAVLRLRGMQAGCKEITATLTLRVLKEGGALRVAFDLQSLMMFGLRVAQG